MILAEKIIKLRKQNGWSQEELAERLSVSRQSVSKWESASSIPDLNKIIKLSEIFSVSTDYLLRDEIEEELPVAVGFADRDENIEMARPVSIEDADTYMNLIEHTAGKIGLGVALCIMSPIVLILLAALSEYQIIQITEGMAAGVGVTILLLLIAAAVTIFIMNGMQLDKYEYLEKETISLDYGVAGVVEVKKNEFEPTFKKCIASGVALCIISAVPIMMVAAFDLQELMMIYGVCALLAMVAFAVYLFVWSGMIWGSYQKLLEEGDYTREKKLENKKNDNLSKVYWCTVTAIYLGVSFITSNWHITWVIWLCAGVMFAAVCGVAAMLRK